MNTKASPQYSFQQSFRKGLVTLFIALVVVLAFTGLADDWGHERVEEGFERSLVAFGVARALNGVISVAQHTGVAFQPAGVGVELAPGQILDPINDLVERFSWVMLAASTSFGIQRLLLELFSWTAVNLLMALFAGLIIAALWSGGGVWKARRGWLLRAGLLILMVRFLVPVLAIIGEGIHEAIIEPRYIEAVDGLEATAEHLGELTISEALEEESDPSLTSQLRSWYAEAGAVFDVDSRLARYKELAAAVSEQTIELIVIFTFQTAILPLLFLWLMVFVYRALIRSWLRPGHSEPRNQEGV